VILFITYAIVRRPGDASGQRNRQCWNEADPKLLPSIAATHSFLILREIAGLRSSVWNCNSLSKAREAREKSSLFRVVACKQVVNYISKVHKRVVFGRLLEITVCA
jgi:hypothetical protein